MPEGSPTRPVAPPRSATGVWPHRWNHARTTMPRRFRVERIRGGVEAAVDGQRSLRARLAELVLVGARVEQAALLEDVDDVSLGERGGGGFVAVAEDAWRRVRSAARLAGCQAGWRWAREATARSGEVCGVNTKWRPAGVAAEAARARRRRATRWQLMPCGSGRGSGRGSGDWFRA